jgi:hypothetical protein
MIRRVLALFALTTAVAIAAGPTLEGPATAKVGAEVAVTVSGSTNPRDFVTIIAKGSRDGAFDAYVYVSKPGGIKLQAPTKPGDYEIRLMGSAPPYPTLAKQALRVESTNATLEAPAEAVARSTISVRWQGPNNPNDYITLVPKGSRDAEYGSYGYTAKGNPVSLLVPPTAGDYELRYVTGASNATLGTAPIRVTPSRQEPGLISVTAANGLGPDSGVEIILDASGSMLQKIGSQRRIDIAKQTLNTLTSETIPAKTPFALRVFGREANSCQTDLDLLLAPLDPAAAGARINALEAKNNAKTPIGASLLKVADDLKTVKGERLIILVTDGEETCGGDPAAAIEMLKKGGATVRVNIVGFAVDEAAIAATFRRWTDAGNGLYFDAKDAASLKSAMSQAVRPAFEVLDSQGQIIASALAGTDPVRVAPGSYSVRLKGQQTPSQKVTVREKDTAAVKF